MPEPGIVVGALERGREAYAAESWSGAYDLLAEADRARPLGLDDLERISICAYLTGRDAEWVELLTRAHREALRASDVDRAARCAFWLGFGLMFRNEPVRGGGWLARAAQHAEDAGKDSVVHGYLRVPVALQHEEAGEFEAAHSAFNEAARIAGLHADADLTTIARLGLGETLIGLGQVTHGVAMLDEAMVAVTAGEVSPMVMGIVYCATIEACGRIFDLGRAHEWTAALSGWCEAHPDLVPYRGSCLVYRADLMTLHGAWPEALDEARRASTAARLASDPVAGPAAYGRGELHRLRGEAEEAEEAYREANRLGRVPQPGLAQLRLDQGRVGAAASAIRRAVDTSIDPAARPRLLDAFVEIALAAGDVEGAGAAADELAELAGGLEAPVLVALAARAEGAVLLAEGEVATGLAELQRALTAWQSVEAPYEAARTRVLIAQACHRLGDDDTAELELDAADHVFRDLHAAPALARLEALRGRPSMGTPPTTPGGLTTRELEVLRLLASGRTNRAIAGELVISEKTVARHVANIFTKLDVSSRSAATAYAYEHDMVAPSA